MTQCVAVCLEQYKIMYVTNSFKKQFLPAFTMLVLLQADGISEQRSVTVMMGSMRSAVMQGASLLRSGLMGERGPGHGDLCLLASALLTGSHSSNP